MNPIIYESDTFYIDVPHKPFVDRDDGGHVRIMSKIKVKDRTELNEEQKVEYIKLSTAVGKALEITMNDIGIEIGNINWQEMGNWSVFKPEGITLHMHIFGRAKEAKIQKYGEAVQLPFRDTGFYDEFKPLTDDDAAQLVKNIEKLFQI